MSKLTEEIVEFETAVADFVESFERVFGEDWDMTKQSIGDGLSILEGATFLNPGVDDENNNWWNRGSLLTDYRSLRAKMRALGVRSSTEVS